MSKKSQFSRRQFLQVSAVAGGAALLAGCAPAATATPTTVPLPDLTSGNAIPLDDLVKGDDCIFAETAITDCAMLRGVRFFGGGARTSTLVLRYKTGTVRFIDTVHRFGEDKPGVRMF